MPLTHLWHLFIADSLLNACVSRDVGLNMSESTSVRGRFLVFFSHRTAARFSKLAAFNAVRPSTASQPHLLSLLGPFPPPLVNSSRCLVGFLDLREMQTAPRNSRRKRPRNALHRVS